MGSPLDGTTCIGLTHVGGTLDWSTNWVVEDANTYIHGLRYCGGPTGGKPHGWVCCIQLGGGCHYH